VRAFLAVVALLVVATASAQDRAGALALVAEAEHSLAAGRPVDALRALRRAEAAGKPLQDDALNAAVHNGFGELYTAIAQFDRAKSNFQQALTLAGPQGGDPRAHALNGLARLDLYGTRYRAAGASLEAALGVSGVRAATRTTTLLLASEHAARSGDLEAARAHAEKANDTASTAGALGAARAAAQFARLAARGAAFSQAFERWNGALARFRALGAGYDTADALANLGELYFQLGLVAESKSFFEEARRLYSTLGNDAGEARALIRLSRAEQRLHRPDLALAHADAALAAARKTHDYVSEAEALAELGEIWIGEPVPEMLALPNPDVAMRHLRAAREIYKDAGDRGAGAWVWLRTGAIQLRAKQYRVATLAFNFVSTTARELDDEDLLWQSLRGEALALAGQNDVPGARQRMEEAIAVLERVYARTAGLSREARSSFLGDRRGIYEEYVEILMRLRLQGAGREIDALAFEASERAKSRQFAELLAAGGAERAAATATPRLRELVARERTIRNDLAQVMRALAAPGAQAGQAGDLAGRAARLNQAHAAVLERVRAEFPRYSELLHPAPVGTAELQAALRPGEVLLSYFVGPRFTAVFVVDRERIALVPVEIPRPELRRLADRLRRPFTEVGGIADLARWRPADAHQLYLRVVEPAAALAAAASALVVAGDDTLYTVPFEALLRSAPPGGDAAPGGPRFAAMVGFDWLGDRYPITYVPSATALRALRGESAPSAWRNALVALADPDFGGGGLAAARGVPLAGRDAALARLPETAEEARAVSRAVKGESSLLLQREASETRLRTLDLSSTRYLLFSTHGLLGGEISAVAEPSLALTLVGNPSGVDGFLTMSEVLSLRLGADLVVLSACNTAGEPGAARIGEGFAGLTRSFMYAGARSLVVSHWPVASEATVVLMTAFFEELGSGKGKAEALAAARRRLRGTVRDGVQLAHPYFWSAFVLVGER
jgi:CHAT domain-containing protein/tetratricopeptide (TPR) repeat protein